jgi:hypothetical protein
MPQKRPFHSILFRLALPVAVVLAAMPLAQPRRVAYAQTNTLHLRVESARDNSNYYNNYTPTVHAGDPVSTYKFIINADNTGDPSQPMTPDCSPATDSDYPANCNWPSIHTVQGASPIVAQGDQNDLDATTHGLNLPNGKYLISVIADGFKIDGEHFSVPLADPGLVTVRAQPFPLPLATLRVRVFEDISPPNGEFDDPEEHGLAGFEGHLDDILGEVTTDWYGNPLCTQYEDDGNGHAALDPDGRPTPIPGTGGRCVSDADGDIVIPNLGPNRYEVKVVPPNGTNWSQTSTLEGGLFWDEWIQEGYTGFDTEKIVGGEPISAVQIGFVRPMNQLPNSATGHIKGVAVGIKTYVPSLGGINFEGLLGNKIDTPIKRPWVALTDLRNNDTTIYAGQGNVDGTFDIPHVPNSDYQVTIWDSELNYLIQAENATVANGQTADMGNFKLAHWWSIVEGDVFIDNNASGKRDPGEPGLPNQVVVLKSRDNSLQDQGTRVVTTDNNGHYILRQTYPLGQWVVEEVYNDRFYTTGVTYQSDNQPEETTFLGAGVDVSTFNLVSLHNRVDWGVKPYAPGTNGGIVGTVTYDVTRNELDPALAAYEDYQPGIPDLLVKLFAPVACDDPGTQICDSDQFYQLASDGAYLKGPLLNTYLTETWQRPVNCTARDVNGDPVSQAVLPPPTGDHECLEAPLMSNQVQTDFSTVNGNYGFTDGCFDDNGQPGPFDETAQDCTSGYTLQALPPGDYLVEVEVPNDQVLGRPLYQVTREEDVNVFGGDQFEPQVPPPPCAGALHTVDVAGSGTDGYSPATLPNGVVVPASAPTDNPSFADGGGSPYEGQPKPLCSMKLVTLPDGRSVAPIFNYFTDTPIPGKVFGLIVDDLNVSVNPKELNYGELAGIPYAPIGIYDWSGRLVHTAHSDANGYFETLLPSVSTYNCPLPAGPCPNMYRFVGNDPGQPGHLNPDYNPQYRTIAAIFQVWPGITLPVDVAPTTVAVAVEGAPTQNLHPAQCLLDSTTPQLFSVSKPYVRTADSGAARQITVKGLGFGATQGSGQVALVNLATNATTSMTINSWSDQQIVFSVPTSLATTGAYQLRIVAGNGQSTINGVTFHVLGAVVGSGTPTNPRLITVNAPTIVSGVPNFSTIQAAFENAAGGPSTRRDLIVAFPGTPASFNPLGAYYENIVMHSPDKLQGVGPGGLYGNGTLVPGSVIDGVGFNSVPATTTAWQALVGGLTWSGNQNVYDGEAVYVLSQDAQWSNANTSVYKPAIDGFTIQGGDQMDFPGNLNDRGGGPVPNPIETGVGVTQGGGIYVNAYARNLQITNNILKSNSGTYGGAIRVGTPYVGDNHNDSIRIANNRLIANGGTNLAGAIGLFAGTNGYEVDHNDICGNFSAEYGGGISHFGLSPSSKIHDNRIYFNGSYDEGAGVMIAGELPSSPTILSAGSGPVDIYNNVIQANLGNDDGGGVRFLQAGNSPINVYNNMVVNNISTHEGGGIALDDATNVRIYNNTIMKNLTTATAATSNGLPAPAGLSDTGNSVLLQATLPPGHAAFSDPLLFNNIFWDNRAGSWDGAGLRGIGLTSDPGAINLWDLGVTDGIGNLSPTYSILTETPINPLHPYNASPTNLLGANPAIVAAFETTVQVLPLRADPHFVGSITIALDVPPTQMGNYHLTSGSPAINAGAASQAAGQPPSPVSAPALDIDSQTRVAPIDIGADELGGGGPPPPTPLVYFSTNSNTPPPGLIDGDDSDIYSFNTSNFFTRIFDAAGPGSAGLPGAADVDALARVGTNLYLSFKTDTAVPGLGTVADEDVVVWNGTAWSLYFDGSDVGFGQAGEDVDAFDILPNGDIIISVNSGADAPGVTAETSSDLLRCVPTSTGPTTACSGGVWSMYFDSSDIGLTTANEDVDGVAVKISGANVDIYFSTLGSYTVPALSGGGDDVWACHAAVTGATASCAGGIAIYYNGSGLAADDLDDFALP